MPTDSPRKAKRDPWPQELGACVRAARKKAGLTQEALAEKAKLAPRTIQKIEAGHIMILASTVRRLRKELGCRYDDLLPD